MKNYFKLFWLPAFGLLFLTFAGYASAPDKTEKATEAEVKQEVKADTEMTEEIFIEITANTMYLFEKYFEKIDDEGLSYEELTDLEAELTEKIAALYEEHGVTDEAFNEFAEEVDEDDRPKIIERISKRVEELRQQE